MGEWMLCEQCHYSWLRDPSRPRPKRCPECSNPVRPISMGDPPRELVYAIEHLVDDYGLAAVQAAINEVSESEDSDG
jgi:hypothetical protein